MIEDKDLKILITAAHAGGKVLRKYFGQAMDLVEKSTVADFQTKADLESEKVILNILKKEFPKYNFLSEEEGQTNNDSDYTFVIDPLDGTNNFVLGIATFAVSIGLLHKGKPVLGVVYQPITDQMFTAKQGKGAYLNGKKIKVSNIKDKKKITIAYTCGYGANLNNLGKAFNALLTAEKKRVLYGWCAAYEHCMLACGKIDSTINNGTELHDFAAGKLIALEAGAHIINFSGKPDKDYSNTQYILSNSLEVNKYLFKIVGKFRN